ncbi:molybdate ABC transporter substrate-binding protein [Sporomusa acidovorans]|uniref:Molybdate-binding protein ModA n=1 Tax=Sporomusa acidovorans (strain ATCC 49682 / DSM 3132 / Mol) TaxID=1123286 RepID=A0ABZ3J246_SPOA4|nr:molybdate ABC transporter substrate-binding protein [Sporomusa acidovorans]OZC15770.1 molybdate-binding periplasmic protein precursor [Sporomusa acidovorans DSM 3132]SDF63174.1 molybdate transport system substrate-binding protein [Sporomusa acidovorans]
MKGRGVVNWIFLLVAAIAVAGTIWATKPVAQAPVKPAAPIEVNLSAALGLKDALTDIQKEYETANPNIKLVFNFGPAGVLQKQLEQGISADIFISASPKQVNELQNKNLVVPTSRKILVADKLVLVVSKNSPSAIEDFQDLTRVEKFGMGEPGTVPAGQYAMEFLKNIGIWENVKDKAVQAKDVRTIISYVESENVDAGIAFSTVAALSDKVKVVAAAPDGSHMPITFPAVIMANAKHPKEAEAFLSYLCSSQSAAIFQKYGFAFVGSSQ